MESSNEKLHTLLNTRIDQLLSSPNLGEVQMDILNYAKLFTELNENRVGAEKYAEYLKLQFKSSFQALLQTIEQTKGTLTLPTLMNFNFIGCIHSGIPSEQKLTKVLRSYQIRGGWGEGRLRDCDRNPPPRPRSPHQELQT